MKIALIGSSGMLGNMLKEIIPEKYSVCCYVHSQLDITNIKQLRYELSELSPQVIINCAAYTKVDDCENNKKLSLDVNGNGPKNLAVVSKEIGSTLVHISTDYVFDGNKDAPYREDDTTNPINQYGYSKLVGEQGIIESGLEKYFIIRTSWLYGPNGKNFVNTMISLFNMKEELSVVCDQIGSPTSTEDLSKAILYIIENLPPYGIYHFSNLGEISWFDFCEEILNQAKTCGIEVKTNKIIPIKTTGYPIKTNRPNYTVLSNHKFVSIGGEIYDWKESLNKYVLTLKGK